MLLRPKAGQVLQQKKTTKRTNLHLEKLLHDIVNQFIYGSGEKTTKLFFKEL